MLPCTWAKMQDVIEAILTRSSVRSFTGEQVPDDALRVFLEAAMAAPSAMNLQPWRFVVVRDKEKLKQLSTGLPYAKMLEGAGTGIVVVGLPGKDSLYADYWVQDCSAATQNILLAAHACGYGAVWTAVYPDREKISLVRKVLMLPADAVPLNVICIGVAAARQALHNKFREENIRYDSW